MRLGHDFQDQKVKYQGHQAALLTAMLARQAAAAVGVGTCGRGKLLLRCRLLGSASRFGTHGGGEGRGISWRPPSYSLFLRGKTSIVTTMMKYACNPITKSGFATFTIFQWDNLWLSSTAAKDLNSVG